MTQRDFCQEPLKADSTFQALVADLQVISDDFDLLVRPIGSKHANSTICELCRGEISEDIRSVGSHQTPLQAALLISEKSLADGVAVTLETSGDVLNSFATPGCQEGSGSPDMLPRCRLPSRHLLQSG